MTRTIIASITFFLLSANCFSSEVLGQPNALWPVIKSKVSEEHKLKLSNQDSSAYLMPDSGPLENAVLFGYQDLVEKFSNNKEMLKKESSISFYLAASLGRLDAINTLISKGVDVDIKYGNDLTPIYAAAEYGELDALKLLLEKGANINHRGNVKYTILILALIEKREKVVEYLLNSEYKVTEDDKKLLKKLWPLKKSK